MNKLTFRKIILFSPSFPPRHWGTFQFFIIKHNATINTIAICIHVPLYTCASHFCMKNSWKLELLSQPTKIFLYGGTNCEISTQWTYHRVTKKDHQNKSMMCYQECIRSWFTNSIQWTYHRVTKKDHQNKSMMCYQERICSWFTNRNRQAAD